ncbi:hypothetical protein, partial [Metallibacterium sp.]|uniref:hypothetical protein n=1 Tax=Metallibacterium sp. TaxID=2940281 RepID=UPI002617E12C
MASYIMRTAHLTTSGENFLMAPSSQMKEPPQVSVRRPHLLFDGLAVARSRLDFGSGRGDDESGAEAGAVAAAVGGSG